MRNRLRIFQHQCHPPSQLPPPSHSLIVQPSNSWLLNLLPLDLLRQWMSFLFSILPTFLLWGTLSSTTPQWYALLFIYYQTAHQVPLSCFSSFISFICVSFPSSYWPRWIFFYFLCPSGRQSQGLHRCQWPQHILLLQRTPKAVQQIASVW